MSTPGWKEALEQFCCVVKRLADSCAEVAEAPDGVVTRGAWIGNIDRIENLLSKFTLAFRGQPAKNMCQPLGELLIQALMDQVALSQLMASQSCSLVAAAVRRRVRQMLEAVMDLAAALDTENEVEAASSTQGRPNKGAVTAAFGVATNSCQRAKQCPLDAHRATASELQGAARLIKDAMKELQEMQQWEDEDEDDDGGAAGSDEEWDGFDDLGGDKLNDEERTMVVSCEQLLRGSGALLEKVASMLAKTAPSAESCVELARRPLTGPITTKDEESWATRLAEIAGGVQERVDELVSILYEFDARGVGVAAKNLLETVDSVIGVVLDLPVTEMARLAGMDMAKVFAVVRKICEESVQHLNTPSEAA